MIRTVGTMPELLGVFKNAQRVVVTVITAGGGVYVGTSRHQLRTQIGGFQQGTNVTQTGGPVALDVVGEIYWIGSAEGTICDLLEPGAL